MQPSPSKCHPDNLVSFVFISISIGCGNVVNDISVVCADRRGGDGVGEAVVAVVAVVAIDIGVNHHGSGAIGCVVFVIISVVVGVIDAAVVFDSGKTSVVGNVVVILVSAVFAVAVAVAVAVTGVTGVFVIVVTDIAIFILFFSP